MVYPKVLFPLYFIIKVTLKRLPMSALSLCPARTSSICQISLGTKMQANITSGDCFLSLAYLFRKLASP